MPSNNELVYNISVQGIKGAVTDANQLEAALKKLYAILATTTQGTKAWNQAIREIRQATVVHQQMTTQMATGLNQTQTASANASMALLNLNYVIRDSPYFFNNFALGVLAVGNNINPLIDSFARLRQEAGDKSISTFTLLKQALVGGAGISIAFSVVVTAIQAFVFHMSKAKSETEQMAEHTGELAVNMDEVKKAVDSLRDSYRKGQTTKEASWAVFGLERLVELRRQLQEWKNKEIKSIASGDTLGLGFIRQEMNKVQNEINMIAQAWSNTSANQDKAKESAKAYAKEVTKLLQEMLDTLLKSPGDKIRDMSLLNPFSEFNLRENLGMTGRQNVKNPMQEMIKDIERELKPRFENITQIANIAGNAISNAFLSGKNAIEAATQALLQFAVQLLFITGIKSLLGFAIGGAPGAAIAVAGFPKASSLNKGAIQVTGRITADRNNFIADIKNAENYYNKNEQFITIGR